MMWTSSSRNSGTSVAVFVIVASNPSSSTQLPIKFMRSCENFLFNDEALRVTMCSYEGCQGWLPLTVTAGPSHLGTNGNAGSLVQCCRIYLALQQHMRQCPPAVALGSDTRYRAWYTHTLVTSATVLSSSSSGVYVSPSTRTCKDSGDSRLQSSLGTPTCCNPSAGDFTPQQTEKTICCETA